MKENKMQERESLLIKRLKHEELPPVLLSYDAHGQEISTAIHPTRNQSDMLLAETLLGCPLPPFLKRVYMEVGDGGFGPVYGLARIFTPEHEDAWGNTLSIVHTTLLFREWGSWPAHLLFLCSMGRTIYACIDYLHPPHPIIKIDQATEIDIEAPSLQQWLENWLDGVR